MHICLDIKNKPQSTETLSKAMESNLVSFPNKPHFQDKEGATKYYDHIRKVFVRAIQVAMEINLEIPWFGNTSISSRERTNKISTVTQKSADQ